MTLRVLCRGGLFCWENIKLNQFSVERCFLGRSRDQLLQRKLKFIRSRALLTIIHVCRDFQAIGDSIYYSILMLRVFRSSQNDMIRSGTQKLYDYLLRTLPLLMYVFTERCEWQSTDAQFQGDFSKSDSMTNVFQLPFLSIIKVDLPA